MHGASPPIGLSQAEAEARLASEGPNEIARGRRRSTLQVAVEVLREPMLALLIGGGILYLILGDHIEAAMLLLFATISVAVTIIQETRTEHVLDALRDLSAPRALLVRDGERRRLPGRDVVRGDVVVLEQGDRVPADGRLIEAFDLQVDESLLTGESLPVDKEADAEDPAVAGGSLVTRGGGLAEVTATGPRSRIGQIGQSLAELSSEPPRLRQETAAIVRLCATGGLALSALVVLLYGLLRGGWADALLAGIAIGMSLLPEEFPVVLTVFLVMGAWRIGQVGVLTRRPAAIETLGSATVLCTDKTGTLTENRMAVAMLWSPQAGVVRVRAGTVPEDLAPLLRASMLASPVTPADPMEIALHEAQTGLPEPDGAGQWELVHTHGLRRDLMAMANLWDTGQDGAAFQVAAKGAPEAISSLCGLSPHNHAEMIRGVEAMAAEGIRVLGVATATTASRGPAESARGYDFALAGLVGLADPLRPGIAVAIAECQAAGIRVVMITGDHAATAGAIAREAGIVTGGIVTGAELATLDDAALAARLADVTIFARIQPEQKLRIVQAFKARGEIVAMTGDGVNDAPALKAAHIGIAMGRRGTDVAREAAALVLLQDDFASIVAAIRLGRRIYDNIRKAMAFIFAVHVPVAGLALLPLALGLPLILGPIHIALIEMVIDPVCAIVFEAEAAEPDTMRRPPRHPDERLFSWRMIVWSVAQGGLAFAACATVLLVALGSGLPEGEARAMTFFTLIAATFALILANRAFATSLRGAVTGRNRALRRVVLSVAAVAATILLVPVLRDTLRFDPLGFGQLAIAAGVGGMLLLLLEQLKRLTRPAAG